MDSDMSSLSDDYEEPIERIRRRTVRNREDPFEMLDSIDFQQRYRLKKETVMSLIHEIGNEIEYSSLRNNCVSARTQILVALRFYATGAFQKLVGDHIKIHNSTVCRIIRKVTSKIARLGRQHIQMPKTEAEITEIKAGFYNLHGFPRVVGALDCTHVKIQSPGGPNAELYRYRKGYFSLNVPAICDSKLKIRHIIARWLGSVHDSTIFNDSPLPVEFEMGAYNNGVLIGDSAYPCKPYLLTSILNPSSGSEEAYNQVHILTRNSIERCFGVLKRRFPCLQIGLRVNLALITQIIVTCAALHNIFKEQNDIFEHDGQDIIEGDFDEDFDILLHYNQNDNVNYATRTAFISTVFAR
ncbi:DDE Tnp 4 and/or Plant tran domain containing protein [Asbolus verrucosus]|uniref:DDE Tnp 4 and/or Plant tran domain containing protein n=1 Tax=Asbolus verrucosus TaxID=1661398 RepID=A0A482WCS9_ASBVE|nr:DDE Tnp 4 and/or Plant tran domain containing protein [Asbolus verrucosus]